MAMQAADIIKAVETLVNVTLGHCMFRCLQLDTCKSFNYDHQHSQCIMLAVDRSHASDSQRISFIHAAHSDYYEIMCPERTGTCLLITVVVVVVVINAFSC